MFEQGRSRLPMDENGRILDRLSGMEEIITPRLALQALAATGKRTKRRCTLTNEIMIWVVVAMGLFTELPIRQVFKAARRLRKGERSPSRSALCMARQRLGSEPMKELHRLIIKPMATAQTPWAFYRGMRKVGIDGTVLDIPDCDEHQHFGRASGSRGDAPFPQVRKVSLVELGTHIEFDFVYGGWKDSERKLVESLWDSIPADALLIEDRGFYSYNCWKKLHQKHHLLMRIQKSMVFKPIKTFADGSFLAKVYRSNWYRNNDHGGIVVRIIEYKLDDPQRTGHDEVHRVITNLLEADEYPAMELIMEYHERWEEEIVFDEQKTHQDPCRAEKTTNLRSETSDGLIQEMYALSFGHYIVRVMMLKAAMEAGIDVDRLVVQREFPDSKNSSSRTFPNGSTPSSGKSVVNESRPAKPNQPACYQTQNVTMEQMPQRTSEAKTADQNLCADGSYDSLNGIAFNPDPKGRRCLVLRKLLKRPRLRYPVKR